MRFRSPSPQSVLPELVAFVLGLALAWWLHLQPWDLVWSLWLGSLLLGFVSILIGLMGVTLWWSREVKASEEQELSVKTWIGGLLVTGALLAFFAFHFCGFHAIHASFLVDYFPVQGLRSKEFSDAFLNPVRLLGIALRDLIPHYGWWLLPLLISEAGRQWRFFQKTRSEQRDGDPPVMGHLMVRPYASVMKMHALIFVFAGCRALGIGGFGVVAIVSLFYFFPWRVLTGFAETGSE